MPYVLTGTFAVVAALILYFISTGQLHAGLGATAVIVALVLLVLGLRTQR